MATGGRTRDDRQPPVPALAGDEPVTLPDMATLGHAVRRGLDRFRWDDRHRRLSRQPLFAACSRNDIRRIIRSGDEVQVGAGETVANEDTIGYWFFVVLGGALQLSRRGRAVATLGPGQHVGEIAILGFGPQPATVTATVDSTLFVVGRRDFLSLAYNVPALQGRLFPGIGTDQFIDHVRALWSDADAAWKELQRERPVVASSRAEALRHFRSLPPQGPGAFTRLATRAFASDERRPPNAPRPTPNRRVRLAVGAVTATTLVGAAVAGLLLYHPPVATVTPGDPIDVIGDITITGAPATAVAGSYLLTPVRYDQPSLLGAAVAVATGQTMVPIDEPAGEDPATAVRAGQAVFRRSQSDAATMVVRAAGLDPDVVSVSFAPRDLQGGSAELIYALAVADLLDPADLARGRRIAATGGLDADGSVEAVNYVWVKASAARTGRADVFLVPPAQRVPAGESGATVHEVSTFAEALALLRQ